MQKTNFNFNFMQTPEFLSKVESILKQESMITRPLGV